jgi:hypothetical protein
MQAHNGVAVSVARTVAVTSVAPVVAAAVGQLSAQQLQWQQWLMVEITWAVGAVVQSNGQGF